MLKPTLDVSTLLDVDAHSVVVTDNTDYAAIGITPADVKIAVEITTPVGLLYINPNYNTPVTSPDITSTSLSYTNTGLPLSGGKFIVGDYTVKLKWYSVDTEETFEYTYTQTINFEKPCVKFDPESDCFCAKLTSKDITDYSGSTQVDYEHKIYYPAATEEEPATTGLLEWTDDQLANGVYTMQVATTRTWAYGDNFSVSQTLTGKSDYQVDCSGICDIRCGFNGLWNKYEEIKGKDKKSADILLAKINRATALWTLVSLNRKCGKVDTSNSYMAELKEILGDCGCDDCGSDEDIWVTGVCGSSGGPGTAFDYVFESCNNLINIDTDITGDTKTVTICLSQATLNTLVTNQFNTLATTIMATLNASWFEGLDTSALAGFPTGGTEEDKRQYILDSLADLLATPVPVAQPDYSVTAYNTTVDKLVTENDFFSSDVVVTITTAPSNGVATVRPDGKTIRFVPTTGYSGADQVGYTITDGEGRTSSAIWYITVNPIAAIACSTVTPLYNLSLSNSGAYLQLVMVNLSTYGTNVITLEQYTVDIRDAANTILHSYVVTGSTTTDPTVYITPDAIASNWNNVRVLLTTTSDAATGGACGTETYETPTPFLITDIVTSWFEGTTIPACIGISGSDTEIVKKNKLMDSICKPIYVENGLTGNGLTGTPIKQGGTFTEDTTINANDKNYSLNNYKKLSYLHGGATTNGVGVLTENVVKLNNFNESNGYVAFVEDVESTLDDYALTNGKVLISKVNNHTVKIQSNITTAQLGNGSLLGNSFDGFTVDSVAGDYSISQDQTSGRRNIVNRRIATQLSPLGLVNKATIGSFANLELITNANNVFCNTWQHFVQLYIRNAKGSGSIQATLTDMPLTYGIYQEGVADKNIFFGEVQNASGSVQFTSDIRVKENIQPFTKSLTELEKIETKTFEYKYNKGKTITGIIAQELEEVIPEAVEKGKFTRPDNNETFDDFRMVDQSIIFYTMLNSIKELSAKNKELELRINALENK